MARTRIDFQFVRRSHGLKDFRQPVYRSHPDDQVIVAGKHQDRHTALLNLRLNGSSSG